MSDQVFRFDLEDILELDDGFFWLIVFDVRFAPLDEGGDTIFIAGAARYEEHAKQRGDDIENSVPFAQKMAQRHQMNPLQVVQGAWPEGNKIGPRECVIP